MAQVDSKVDGGVAGLASLAEAVETVKSYSEKVKARKFVETVELVVNLGIDPKQSNQAVRGSVALPSGSGRDVRVVVFTGDDKLQKEAMDGGAVFAGLDDLIEKINGGFLDFDYCIATPDSMQKISKVAKKLGPRGLMPNPKNGNITTNVAKVLKEAKKGKANFKNDKFGIIHCAVGKVNFTAEQLIENVRAVMRAVKDLKPEGAKGKYLRCAYLTSTMGASVELGVEDL